MADAKVVVEIKTEVDTQEIGIKDKLRILRDALFSAYEKARLKQKSYVIISNNCWGYELYSNTGREYNTPFIGLFLFPECYLEFLENFQACMAAELSFIDQSKYYPTKKHYPIGLINGNIEIHFLHYASEQEARDKWVRRSARFNDAVVSGADIYFKLCDSEACSKAHLTRFHALPFEYKLSLGLQSFVHRNHLHLPFLVNKKGTALVDGAKLFKKRYSYFDLTHWLLTGRIAKTLTSRVLSFIS